MSRPVDDDNPYDDGSRVEAAEAGLSHERAEAESGIAPREHVTAAASIHHHHPADANAGIVRGRPGKHALLAGALAAAATAVAVVLLALAIGTH